MMDQTSAPLLEMVGISKRFGSVQALSDVNFVVNHREVVGLVGDNGAGKSTLIKILMGVYPATEGEIRFLGRQVKFSSPVEARANGIEPVYQDLALMELMSIWRNFFLGKEKLVARRFFRPLDKAAMRKETEEAIRGIGVNLRSSNESTGTLSGGERQAISIGRCIHFGAKLLILDEPTAALSVKEASKVLDLVTSARDKGISTVLISHNILHVYSVADRFTILDRGKVLRDCRKDEVSPDDLIKMIATGKLLDLEARANLTT